MSRPAAKNANQTKLPSVGELIARQMDELGMKDENSRLAALTGYNSGSVIAMLKAGTMKLPPNKIPVFATALRIDPYYLLMCRDQNGELGLKDLVDSIVSRPVLTHNEEKIIQRLRKVNNGLDIDPDEYPQDFEVLVSAFKNMADHESISHETTIARLSKPSSALARNRVRAQEAND